MQTHKETLLSVIIITATLIIGCILGYLITIVQNIENKQKEVTKAALVEFFEENEISIDLPK